MCGIAGRVALEGGPDRALLARQLDALVHRGPDGSGMHLDGEIALGMRRLAVIDVEHGQQPLYSEDGTVVVVGNGELYEHRAQQAQLEARGHVFATGSDIEIVVHLYEEHGIDVVHHLHGMFAIALWDAARGRLLLARDRMGKKPLLWAGPRPGVLVFGSEARAVLADPDVPRTLDLEALDATLATQYVPPDRTPWAAVRPLPPGGRLVWETADAVPRTDVWWSPTFGPKRRLRMADAAAELRVLLQDAVTRRLEAEVPVGAFLSGGLDSSAVVAAMARAGGDPVRTFSARFSEAGYDEGPHARAVADHCGTLHTELHIGPIDADGLLDLVRRVGTPLADPAVVPAFQLAALAAEHVTVVLTGDGGDELLAGYRRHHQLAWTRPAQALPAGLRRRLPVPPGLPPRVRRLAGLLALDPDHRYADLFRHFREADRQLLYGERLRPLLTAGRPLRAVEDAWAAGAGLAWTDRLLACDQAAYLPGDLLPKADLTSMAHGLELRSPLLDQELVDWAGRLPPRLKRRGAAGKLVLKAAVAPWLPPEIPGRPKQGFAVPVGAWLRGPLSELAHDVLLDRRIADRGLLDPAGTAATLAAHLRGEDRSAVLWSMLVLELWCRTALDEDAVPDRPELLCR